MKFVLLVVGLLLSGASSEPDKRFTTIIGETESECDDPSIQPGTGICEPECYCIPDTEPCDVCPSLENRVIAASPQGFQEAAFFRELEVDNTETLFTYDPPGCQPFPRVAAALGGTVPVCEGLIQEGNSSKSSKKSKKSKRGKTRKQDNKTGPVQCSFNYKRNICNTKRYDLVEETKTNIVSKSSTSVTHEGECGVCSTAKDLAVNLSPTLGRDAFLCAADLIEALQSRDPQGFPNLIECFVQIGFTPDCAFIWASNGFNTNLAIGAAARALATGTPPPPGTPESCSACAQTCLADPTLPECALPLKQGTCELSNCFACDEDVSGPIFAQFSGRTRRNSGIVTTFPNPAISDSPFVGTKRPCSTIANVKQPSRTCEL